MVQVEELVKKAKRMKGCRKGIEQLKNCITVHDMINCLYDYIDYCIVKGFPSKDDLLKLDKGLRIAAGIYIDERVTIGNPHKLLLIDSDATVSVGSYNVCRAYLVGNSRMNIQSCQHAVTMIDALGESNVNVVANDPSRVIVNLYAKAKCEGATKVNATEFETYEL